MRKKTKKENKKMDFNEKLQLWSDRLLLGISIMLFVLAVIGFVLFYVK